MADQGEFWRLVREAAQAIDEFDQFDPRSPEDRGELNRLCRAADRAGHDLAVYAKTNFDDLETWLAMPYQHSHMECSVASASGFWLWFLRKTGFAAITMPWRKIYVLPEHIMNQSLLRHELVHIEQITRDGPIAFSIKYLWWLIRHGYWKNPYEIEAYEKEPIKRI